MRVSSAIFTDLDGTLLDFHTYLPSPPAIALLRELEAMRIRVIPVSSKTSAEVRPLMKELGLSGPAILEGGPVIVWEDGSESVTGPCRADLVDVLHQLQDRGWGVRGMSEMSVGEVMGLTGLGDGAARRAMTRSASEPFVMADDPSPSGTAGIADAIVELGASLARGGRFRHLLGRGVGKGAGVRSVLAMIHTIEWARTAAIGDAWNDLPMLEEAKIGFLLGNAVEPEAVPPGVTRLERTGPQGFIDAVGQILGTWNAAIPG
jgi:mannosyl-3-phosphoglycerate phosphatase family protein